MHFMPVNKSKIVIYSHFEDGLFTAVKRDAKFSTRYVKGVSFFNKRYSNGGLTPLGEN